MNPLKSAVKSLLESMGYEVRRKRDAAPAAAPPPSAPAFRANGQSPLAGSLSQIQALGFKPATVLDVGAAHGEFTSACHQLFPDARCLLVEPLSEFRPGLEKLTRQFPGTIFENVAAGKQDGSATFHVHRDWDGSSLYRETEGVRVDGVERTVPMRALDSLVTQYQLPPPYLLKADVQGAELDVLAGGLNTLRSSEYVLLEVTFFGFFVGAPQFADVVEFMRVQGFVVYDIFSPLYRPLDGALSQVDLAFVRAEGMFREHHIYASPEQRAAQDRQFDSYHLHHSQNS